MPQPSGSLAQEVWRAVTQEPAGEGVAGQGEGGGGPVTRQHLRFQDAVLAKNTRMSVTREPTQSSCICQSDGGELAVGADSGAG